MRIIITLALLVSACSGKAPDKGPALAVGTYAGEGRDRLCVVGEAGVQRAGFVSYGPGHANCTMSGRIEANGAGFVLTPAGDSRCLVDVSVNDGRISLAPGTPACHYYCGPSASFANKNFRRDDKATPAVDLAGDKLCQKK
jgi:hypothetical protein